MPFPISIPGRIIKSKKTIQGTTTIINRVNKIYCTVVVYSIFLALSVCHGQNTDSLLTWQECVSLASRNNPQVASSQNALDASRFSYYANYNGLLPKLNLNHGYSSAVNSPIGTSSDFSNWQTVGSVSLDVLNMSEIANIKTSKTVISQFEANRQQTASQVRFNLRKAFAQLLYVQKSIEVSRNIVTMRQEQAQLVTLRYNSGRESKGNMLRAIAEHLQAQADLDQTIRDLRIARQNINTQMGVEKFTPFSATGSLDAQPPPDLPKDEEALLNHRPDILLAEAVTVTADASLNQAKSSYWPDLSVGFSLIGQGLGGFSSLHNSWNIDLNYPLYSNGPARAYYAVSIAKSNVEKAKQDLRSAREQAILDIETAWSAFSGAFDQSKVQTALLEAARQRNDEANIRYESGLLTYDNWEIIASDRVSQERKTIQAQLDVATAEAAWENALGRQLEE